MKAQILLTLPLSANYGGAFCGFDVCSALPGKTLDIPP